MGHGDLMGQTAFLPFLSTNCSRTFFQYIEEPVQCTVLRGYVYRAKGYFSEIQSLSKVIKTEIELRLIYTLEPLYYHRLQSNLLY
jgi:hypothetical protein